MDILPRQSCADLGSKATDTLVLVSQKNPRIGYNALRRLNQYFEYYHRIIGHAGDRPSFHPNKQVHSGGSHENLQNQQSSSTPPADHRSPTSASNDAIIHIIQRASLPPSTESTESDQTRKCERFWKCLIVDIITKMTETVLSAIEWLLCSMEITIFVEESYLRSAS